MGIRNKVTGEMYTITSYNPTTGNITGINNTTGNSDLGNVSNIYIGGGNPGEILSTDGAGNLSWIPDGGGANTGNVTFDDVTVQGDNFLNLSAGPDYTANLAYLQLRAGDFPSHIHLDTGNNEAYDLIIGNDSKFVQVSSTGNILMSSYDGVNSYQMTLDTTGNLTLPGNTFAVNYANGTQVSIDDIQSQIANGNSNVSVPTSNDNVYINVNGGTQKQWIFDTDGNLRTPGNVDIYGSINFPQQVSNINWSTYNIELSQYGRINTNVDFFANANVIGAQYLKGDGSNITNISTSAIANGTSNVSIPTSNGNIAISVGSNSWVFGTDSNLTLADGGFLVVSGGIVGGGASPAPYLSGFSSLATTGALGNITASGFFIGNGSQLTGLPVPTVIQDITSVGDMSIMTYDGNIKYVSNATIEPATGDIGSAGNIVAVGNVQGAFLKGDGGYLSNIAGANITGEVSFAATANSVVGANVTGEVASANVAYIATFASTANAVAGGNVLGEVSFAAVANSVAGANVTGEVALANTVSNPAQPNITSVGTLVSLTTDSLNTTGLFTANGNAQFNADVYFAGNVTLPGNINQISGNSASFFGDPATGFGALYVGLPTGYTLLDNEVAQFSDNFNGYTQVTHRNINGGDQATGDFVITADNGTDLVNHIDLGIAGSGYDGALANNSLGTALYPNDGYLYTRGNVTGGNLILGSNQTNGVVRIIANGASNIGDTVATFAANGLTVANAVTAAHFIGEAGNLSNITAGNITGTVASATVAASANSVSGANVSGQVAFATTANAVAGANVSGQVGLATFAATANSVAGANVSGQVSFAATANSVAGANVSGTVASATVAASANSVAGANVSDAVAFATTANAVSGANVSGQVASAAAADLATFATTANAVAGANVTGTVASATVAASANSVAGANVTGTVSAATTAGTVTSAAQANITSVGTLTALAISGVSNLNSVGNVIITGGTNGQVLTTDGSGNLSWSTVSGGGGIPGGSNTQVQFNDAGTFSGSANFTFNKTTDTFTVTGTSAATTFSGSGASLTTLNASNISSGTLSQTRLANAAVTLGSTALTLGSTVTTVAGLTSVTSTTFVGALTGAATSATTAGTVTTAAQPNITSTGTLTSLTSSGNIIASNVIANSTVFATTSNISGNVNAGNVTATGTIIATNIGNATTILAGDGGLISNISGGSSYGNANVTTLLSSNTVTSNITTTGNVSGGFLLGNIAQATGLGNISTINLNGNASTVLSGAGTFVAQSSGGGGVTSIVAGTGITIDPAGGTGAVTVNYSGGVYNNSDVQSFLDGTGFGGLFEGPLIVAGLTPSITGANSAAPVLISNYAEVVADNGGVSGTLAIEPSEGTIQRYTLTGNITINGFTTAVAGTNVTLILKQDATGGRTLTSTMKFLGGVKTLSTAANAIDVLSVFYDGVDYLATLGKGYA